MMKAQPVKNRIAREWRDCDGYWIVLAPGWICDGAKGFREDTKAKAYARLKEAKQGKEA